MRRLRSYKEVFFERFWVKLARYAAGGRRLQQNNRGVLVMGRQFTSGGFMRVEAQVFGPDANPLAESVPVKAFVSPLNSDDPKDRKEIKLSPKRSSNVWGGWFQGRQLMETAGEYKIEVPIPGTPDSLRQKFLVKESNPELDMVRPDYVAMYQMAGTIDEVAGRLEKPTLDKLRETLEKRRVVVDKKDAAADAAPGDSPDKPHLYFDLRSAEIIPDCMQYLPKQSKNRGKVEDLWDKGFVIGKDPVAFVLWLLTSAAVGILGLVGIVWLIIAVIRSFAGRFEFGQLLSPLTCLAVWIFGSVLCVGVAWLARRDPSIVLPYVLVAIVGLLSVEWLTRKLLRLA
jgi:hypothetical protein